MTRIVSYVHRPKRPPRNKAQAAAITGPAIVTGKGKRTLRQFADVVASDEPANETSRHAGEVARRRKNQWRPGTIVTAKNPHRRGKLGDVPDMTPEEYERRCNAADALFRELVRRATGKQ